MLNGFFIATAGVSTATSRAAAQELAQVNYIAEAPPYVPGDDPVYSPDYYISISGDDAADGTSEATAWRTLAKVEGASFFPGMVIAFKRGDIWNDALTISDSGTSGNEIIYTSYGSGERPILNGNADFSTSWVADNTYHSNMYRASASEVSRLWKDGVEQKSVTQRSDKLSSYGWDEMGIDDCVWIWYNNYLWYYSPSGTPTGQFSGDNVGNVLRVTNQSYVKVSGLDLRGGNECVDAQNSDHCTFEYSNIGFNAVSGIRTDDSTYLTVERNTIDSNFHLWWEGLPSSYAGTDNRGCYDGIIAYGAMNNSIVRYNDFKDWGHSAFCIQGSGQVARYNEVAYNYFDFSNVSYGRAFDINNYNTQYNEVHHNRINKQKASSHFTAKNNHWHHNYWKDTERSTLKYGGEEGACIDVSKVSTDDLVGNTLEYNTLDTAEGPGVVFWATAVSTDNISDNIFNKNLGINLGTNPTYSCATDALFHIQNYVDIRWNTYTDNCVQSPTSGDVVCYRDSRVTISEFNALNGSNGDVISGNTHTLTDQGAGDVSYDNTGLRAT